MAGTSSETGVEVHEQEASTSTLPTLRKSTNRLERRRERGDERKEKRDHLYFEVARDKFIYWTADTARMTNERTTEWYERPMACFALIGKKTYAIW